MKLRVYTCNIPGQYAFGSLEMAAASPDGVSVFIKKPETASNINTSDCIGALKDKTPEANVVAFLWLDEHERELPAKSFDFRDLFKDPLGIVLPRTNLYLSFMENHRLEDGSPINHSQLTELLKRPYASQQVVLLREKGSATRRQICQFLGSDPEDDGLLCETQAEYNYTDTVQLYRKILLHATPPPGPDQTKYYIGFVSEKIRRLTSPTLVRSSDVIVLEVPGILRMFKAAYRRGDLPAAEVAQLMAQMAREKDDEGKQGARPRDYFDKAAIDKAFEAEEQRLIEWVTKRTRRWSWILGVLTTALLSVVLWAVLPGVLKNWRTVQPVAWLVTILIQTELIVLCVLGRRLTRFGALRRWIRRATLASQKENLDFLREVKVLARGPQSEGNRANHDLTTPPSG